MRPKDTEPLQGNDKEEEAKEHPLLRDVLINTTFAKNRAIADDVQKIALGELNEEADQLMHLTASLPKKEEAAKTLYVTNDGKLLIQRKPQIGTETNMVIPVHVRVNPGLAFSKRERQDRFLGTIMHTHGIIDTTPSDADLIPPFVEDTDPAAGTATFVITQTQKIVVFRSPRSPEMTMKEARDEMMKNRLRAQSYFLDTHAAQPNLSVEDLNQRMNMQLFRDMVDRYQLSVFTAMGKSGILRKQTA